MRLAGKVAIITGAGQGIGKATALRFAGEGAIIAVVDFNEQTGQAAAEEIQAQGGQALFIKADVAKHDQALQMAQIVNEKFGRIDVLVNNAGILRDARLVKLS